MTERAPPSMGQRLLRPGVFFPLFLGLVAVSVLFTPRSTAGTDAPRLSTYSTLPGGASGFSQAAKRLGWRTVRLEAPLSDTLSTEAIYALMFTDDELTREELHVALNRARAGAALLILGGGRGVRDSLHIDVDPAAGELVRPRDETSGCAAERSALRRFAARTPLFVSELTWTGPPRSDTIHLATARLMTFRDNAPTAARFPAIVGLKLGAGRVAVASDAALFANDVIRVCSQGAAVAAVRTLEWLSARDSSPSLRTIVFDEFHLGYGTHASVTHAMTMWMTRTRSGRTTLQLVLAALILLAAAAPRTIPPVARPTVPRRSPLEHVGALAVAYEQVRATRSATRLLVQGVRRRTQRLFPTRRVSDEQYLEALAARHPAIAPDVARVTAALETPVEAPALLELATTIDRIERSTRA